MIRTLFLPFTLLFALFFSLPASADEGMWTLYNLPDGIYRQMQSEGFELPKSMLYEDSAALKNCVVNFSGYCTGEVVSPQGLVLTNHHCGFEAIRSHSTVEHDYMTQGFYADSLAAELPNENMFVAFMRSQRDITPLLDSLGIFSLDREKQEELLDSITEVLTNEAHRQDSTCYVEVDAFYEGNAYYATTYQRYSDIRLVFAPPKSLGKFGGETDNWMWPRQTCDISVFRIYVDPITGGPADYKESNVPMTTKVWLPVSTEGYKDGSFAMVLGYPGSTERYRSSYGIKEMRDCINDPMQQVRGVKQAVMKRHMDASEAVRIKYDSKYAQSSNYWKNAIGMNKCIDSIGIIGMKENYEIRMGRWLVTNGASIASLRSLRIQAMGELYERRRESMRTYTLFAETFTRRSNNELATRATRYNNGMTPLGDPQKPKKQYVQFSDNSDTWDRNLDVEALGAMMQNYREQVPAKYLPAFYQEIDSKYGGNCTQYVENVWDNTVLMTTNRIPVSLSKKLKKDAGIRMCADLKKVMDELKLVIDSLQDSIQEQERLLCAAKLRMEQELPHYSDANFTMRLTYGQVGGYLLNGYDSGYFTTPQSLVEKMKRGGETEDYRAEPEIQALFEGIKSTDSNAAEPPTVGNETLSSLCFLTNNDITGGNSGSPVIDGKGRLIGLAFDGNWDSLSADIFFDTALARCINVDIRYILFVMKHWGRAERLLEEMGVSQK